MRFIVKAAGWLAALALLGGCGTAPQLPVALSGDYGTQAKTGRVGIAVSELPKPDTAFPGAGCLLCLAAASMANSSLTDHARTLSVDELKPLKAELAKLLQAQGIEAVVIDDFGLTAPKTKEMAGVLKAIKVGKAVRTKTENGVEQNVETDVTLNLVAYSTPRPVLTRLIDEFRKTPQGQDITVRATAGFNSCNSAVNAGVFCVSSTAQTLTSGRSAASTRSTSKLPTCAPSSRTPRSGRMREVNSVSPCTRTSKRA